MFRLQRLYRFLLTFLVISMGLGSCSDTEQPSDPVLVVSETMLQFSRQSGEKNITIRSDQKISASVDQAWCNVTLGDALTGSGGYLITQLTVAVNANSEPEERTASITVRTASLTQTINVKQSQNDLLIVKKSAYEVSYQGGTIGVELQTNGDYQVSWDAFWISQSSTRSVSDKSEFFTVSPNPTSSVREASILFTLNDLSETVTIRQAANSNSMTSDAMTMAAKMTIGWNIGNSLEATSATSASETMWGNPKVTKELITAVKAAGFNAIRIPCAWSGYIEDPSTHKIRESWLNRVEEVVNYCLENEMVAILNIHWDGGWLENNCTPDKQVANNEKQHALWTQIAEHFRDYGENLLFAGTNEPNVENATQMAVLHSYLQTFIDAVRATEGNNSYRNLIIQGPSTDITKTNELMTTLPTDPAENRLMIEIHYYSPWNFCGLLQDESWGKMFYYWGSGYHFGDPVRDANWGEEEYVNAQFALMKAQFIDKNIPVIMGEYGAVKRTLNTQAEQDAHEASRLYFLEFVTQRAKAVGMIPFYWDNGGTDSRLFDRSSNAVVDQKTLNALMKGAKQQ